MTVRQVPCPTHGRPRQRIATRGSRRGLLESARNRSLRPDRRPAEQTGEDATQRDQEDALDDQRELDADLAAGSHGEYGATYALESEAVLAGEIADAPSRLSPRPVARADETSARMDPRAAARRCPPPRRDAGCSRHGEPLSDPPGSVVASGKGRRR